LDEGQWYYALEGQQRGPVSLDRLATILAAQNEPRELPVWREGLSAWVRVGDVPELLARLAARPVWHVGEGGKTRGPLTLGELLGALIELPEPREALVWKVGLETWTRASDLRELAEQLPPPIPVATPAAKPGLGALPRGADSKTPQSPETRAVGPAVETGPTSPSFPPEVSESLEPPADGPAPSLRRPPPTPPAALGPARRRPGNLQRLGMLALGLVAGYAIVSRFAPTPEVGPGPGPSAPAAGLNMETKGRPRQTPAESPDNREADRKACDAGAAEACTRLGIAYYRRPGLPGDEAFAYELLQRGCDGDSALGCYQLAVALEAAGDDVALGFPSALTLYQKACQLGHGRACRAAGER
jgi:hypothetical protein